MKYDMIIGRPDIRKHDLTQKCRSQFIEPVQESQTMDIVKSERLQVETLALTRGSVVDETRDLVDLSLGPGNTCSVLESIPSGAMRTHVHELIGYENNLVFEPHNISVHRSSFLD